MDTNSDTSDCAPLLHLNDVAVNIDSSGDNDDALSNDLSDEEASDDSDKRARPGSQIMALQNDGEEDDDYDDGSERDVDMEGVSSSDGDWEAY